MEIWNGAPFGSESKIRGRRQVLGDIIVVFLHGVCSGPEVWSKWIEPLRDAVGADFDAVAIRYPSWIWQKCDIRREAAAIHELLQTSFSRYQHVLVVAHSMGGLVVKEMMRTDAERSKALGTPPLFDRVRSIALLAVPHYGGIPYLAKPLCFIYKYVFWPLWKPVAKYNPRWGYYAPSEQLYPMNSWLAQLQRDFRSLLDARADRHALVPIVFDADAKFDEIARTRVEGEVPSSGPYRQWALRHLGWSGHIMKTLEPYVLPGLHLETIPHIAAWDMRGDYASLGLDLAAETIRIVVKFDRKENMISTGQDLDEIVLVSDPDRANELRHGNSAKRYDQQGAFDLACEELERGRDLCLVVTGQGGAGKSVVMRKLAKHFANAYLSNRQSALGPSLPFVMNLKRARKLDEQIAAYVSDGRHPQQLWDILTGWWLAWASELRLDTAIGASGMTAQDRPELTREWLDFGCRHLPTIIFLDSVDEFIIRYPQIGAADFEQLIDHLLRLFSDLVPFRIVIGVRAGMLGIEDLVRNSVPPIVIAPLSLAYASKAFGNEIVDKIENLDSEDLEAILIFFILSALRRSPEVLKGDLTDVSMVFERALEAILKTSFEHESIAVPNGYERKDILLNAVAAIGWAYARNYYAEQSISELCEQLTRIAKEWEGPAPDGTSERDIGALRVAFRLAADPECLSSLLMRSVFTEINDRHGFSHRIWMELAVARYVAQSLAAGNLAALAERTFYRRIFARLGDYLNHMEFSQEFLQRALAHESQFVIGSWGAVQPYTRAAISGDGLKLIADKFSDIPPLARHILLGSMSHRALRKPDRYPDPSRDAIRALLRDRLYPHCLIDPPLASISPATVSLAWCLDRQMFKSAGAGRQSWPQPRESDAMAILDMACPGWSSGDSDPVKIHTLQFGYADTIIACADDPIRQAATAHYLLFLVLAFRAGIATPGAQGKLQTIFNPTSAVERSTSLQVWDGFYRAEVPEIGRLAALCRQIYSGEIWRDFGRAPAAVELTA